VGEEEVGSENNTGMNDAQPDRKLERDIEREKAMLMVVVVVVGCQKGRDRERETAKREISIQCLCGWWNE
jgi:hypothetical protein